MSVRHCDVPPVPVHVAFINCITELTAVIETLPEKPEWGGTLECLLTKKWN